MPARTDPPANDDVHGHDVMALLADAGRSMTRAELEAAIVARFGPAARFHTCTAHGMTAAEIVTFLVGRGKLEARDGKLSTDRGRMCAHDHDHGHAHG